MERKSIKNSTALQAAAGFAAGAALVGVAAWWWKSGKDPSKTSKEVSMAPIPSDIEDITSQSHPSGAETQASAAASQQADNTTDSQDVEEVTLPLDEDIVLAEAIADAPTISWRQTAEEIVLETPVGEDVRAKSVVCNINARSLYLAVQGKVLVDEPLFAPISPDESSWEIGDAEEGRKVTVSLHKANLPASQCNWKMLFATREVAGPEIKGEE